MLKLPASRLVPLALALTAAGASAQGVVLDQGTFSVTLDGRAAGTEEFAIRQSGLAVDGTVIANAVVSLSGPEGRREIRPLLSTKPAGGDAVSYQLEIEGAETARLRLSLFGRRYVSVMRTDEGEEEREFRARPGTRILEEGVAHQYYFLRAAREGSEIPVIEPRTRRQLELTVSGSTDVELTLGSTAVSARRVVFGSEDDRRIVWYDRQGRVLRVEVPARGYAAERTDLVG